MNNKFYLKTERKTSLWRCKGRWEDNIKMHDTETGYEAEAKSNGMSTAVFVFCGN
jgi:hypothetical protein